MRAPGRACTIFSKPGAISSGVYASTTVTCKPIWLAASIVSLRAFTAGGSLGFKRIAIAEGLPQTSRKSSSRFPLSSGDCKLSPVALPPGWPRLATNPFPTGLLATKAIGMVFVARWAACAACVPPAAMMSGLSATNSRDDAENKETDGGDAETRHRASIDTRS